jgi:hypothetical protein
VSADPAKPILLFLRGASVGGYFDFKPAYAAFGQHSPMITFQEAALVMLPPLAASVAIVCR